MRFSRQALKSPRSGSPAPRLTKSSGRWSPARRRNWLRTIVEVLLGLLKSWTRTTAFIGKEVIEVIRRPGALFSLIFGPFIIMGLFGLGYSGQYRPLETVLVVPTDSQLPRDVAFYQQFAGDSVHVADI